MNYQKIEAGFDQAKTLLPDDRRAWFELNRPTISDIFLYGAIEGNDLIGYALYYISEEYSSICALLYIEVKEEYQGNYIGDTLLRESAADLKKSGIEIIKISTSKDDEVLEGIVNKNDYRLLFNSETVSYNLVDIENTLLKEQLPTIQPAFKYIKRYLDFDEKDPALTEFEAWLNETRPGVRLKKLNRRYTCFFESEGKLYGYAAVQKLRKDFIIMKDLHVVKSKYSNVAAPVMLAYLLTNIFNDMPKNSTVTMTFYNRHHLPVLESMLGQPIHRMVYNDYCV